MLGTRKIPCPAVPQSDSAKAPFRDRTSGPSAGREGRRVPGRLLALDKAGRAGAFALQPGFGFAFAFAFAVTDAAGRTRIERPGALFA